MLGARWRLESKEIKGRMGVGKSRVLNHGITGAGCQRSRPSVSHSSVWRSGEDAQGITKPRGRAVRHFPLLGADRLSPSPEAGVDL
jgi:hypothetical protein